MERLLQRVVVPLALACVSTLAGWDSWQAAPALQGQRLVTVCANANDCPVSGSLVVRRDGEAAGRRVVIVGGVAGPEHWTATESVAELESSGFWMPPQRPLHEANGTWSIRVWKTTRIRGRLAVQAPARDLPATVELAAETPPGSREAIVEHGTSFVCPVAPDGQWNCAVPAATLDIVLRAKTFTPYYRWDLKVSPSVVTDFGTVTLRREASMVAWLDSKTARSLKQPATARLLRMTMAASPVLGDRLSAPVAEGAFNRRGMVQLAPVPPGTYTLEVSATGFATSRVDRIEIYPHSESVLRPVLRLDPPVELRLAIDPPHEPGGTPWQLVVSRMDDLSFRQVQVVAETVPATGQVAVPGQSPGHYSVRVADRRGNRYAEREVEAHGPSDPVETIVIPLRRIRGKVTVGNEPLAAELRFGGRSGSERVLANADQEGAFHTILPRAGRWLVDVQDDASGILGAVQVEVGEHDDEVNISLPDTAVRGWVTGTDGKRVEGAIVSVITAGTVLSRNSEADGTFLFRGLRQGRTSLSAADRRTGQHSRVTDVTITEGSPPPAVELSLDSMRSLRGTLTSQGQPLIGTRVTGYVLDGGRARMARAVSGLEGEFELSFPAAAADVALIVASPGRTLQTFRTQVGDRPLALDVAPVGGLLRLEWPSGSAPPAVTCNNTPVPIADLLEWAHANGAGSEADAVTIPNLAPGSYRACVASEHGPVCSDGMLARGGLLRLGGH